MIHDPKSCPLCSKLRHPANGREARLLTQHLAKYPMPHQSKKEKKR